MDATSLPASGVLLCVDYGDKRTGLALTDEDQHFALPHGRIEQTEVDALVTEVAALCTEREVAGILLGLPYNMDGSEGSRAIKTRAFGKALVTATGLPLEYMDERLTSWQVERDFAVMGMKRRQKKQHVDAGAASLMLNAYLDRSGRRAAGSDQSAAMIADMQETSAQAQVASMKNHWAGRKTRSGKRKG